MVRSHFMRSALFSSSLLLAAVTQSALADYDYQDPLSFLATLAEMPETQQDALLKIAGQSLMDQSDDIDCNIFGGKDTCKPIPDSSKFGSACKKYRDDLLVDCAYYSDSEKQLEIHPGDALQHHLGADYNKVSEHCPECISNLQALWCVQALPECGSFQTHMHKAIFPAILEVKQDEDQGYPESVAIASAIPILVDAMSKTMACREMCHATVATCSCGNATLAFGEALENAEVNDQGFADLGLQMLGQNFSDTLFAKIWDKPVCDIFTPKDDPLFAGECNAEVLAAATCSSDAFCDGLSEEKKKSAESVIATQIARSIFGFVDGPAGVVEQGQGVAQNMGFTGGQLPVKKPGTGVSVTPSTSTATTSSTTSSSGSSTVHASATASASSTPAAQDGAVTGSSADALPAVEAKPEPQKKKGSGVGTVFGVIFALAVVGAAGAFGWMKFKEYRLRHRGFADFDGYDRMGLDEGVPLQ